MESIFVYSFGSMNGAPGVHQSLFQGAGGAARTRDTGVFMGLRIWREVDSEQVKYTLRRKSQTGAGAGKKISQVYRTVR